MITPSEKATDPHRISIVVPVYQGERTLRTLIEEILPLTSVTHSPGGRPLIVEEVLLVFDHGPDGSAGLASLEGRTHVLLPVCGCT